MFFFERICAILSLAELRLIIFSFKSKEFSEYSMVEAELETGRTHQIRASFASIGHPLLGDGKYGTNEINKRFAYNGQALYSYKLKFVFNSDGGILEYLNGQEFKVENVTFAEK